MARYIPSWEGYDTPGLAEKYPLQLISTHVRFSYHTQYDNKSPWLDDIPVHRIKKDGYAWWPFRLHPSDAGPRGIQHGDIVKMYNDRGAVLGIAQLTGEVAQAGISPLLEFTAFLTINLAILNLFPIPGLDGGRIIFVLLEWVRRGRRISPRTEGLVHLMGFAFLITVILYFTYYDVLRIVSGGSLIP